MDTKMFVLNLEEDVHRAFKSKCAENDVTMTEQMKILIDRFITSNTVLKENYEIYTPEVSGSVRYSIIIYREIEQFLRNRPDQLAPCIHVFMLEAKRRIEAANQGVMPLPLKDILRKEVKKEEIKKIIQSIQNEVELKLKQTFVEVTDKKLSNDEKRQI
jgi:hypothetical protein